MVVRVNTDILGCWPSLWLNWMNAIIRRTASEDSDETTKRLQDEDLFLPSYKLSAKNATIYFEQCRCIDGGQFAPPTYRSVFKTSSILYGRRFIYSAFLFLLYVFSQVISPAILKSIILQMQSESSSETTIIFLAISLGVVTFLGQLCKTHSIHIITLFLFELRAALTNTVYQKILRLNTSSIEAGRIMNLITTDCQRMLEFMIGLHMAWSAPLIIGVSMYLMYREVGNATFACIATMLLALPIGGKLAGMMSNVQRKVNTTTDQRISTTSSIIEGVQVIKYYGWSSCCASLILSKRQEELKYLRIYAYIKACSFSVFTIVPFFASVITFVTFAASGGKVTAANAFTTLALIHVIQFPFTFLPLALNYWVQTYLSLKRIEDFLNIPELLSDHIETTSKSVVDIKEVSFDYRSTPNLKLSVSCDCDNISNSIPIVSPKSSNGCLHQQNNVGPLLPEVNFKADEGQLVGVMGTIASGKSLLICSILGEATRTGYSGYMRVSERIAYVPQVPFIRSGTIRENIVFDQPWDDEFYYQVIECCQLSEDLRIWPDGDLTEIGERGINVSGGQRQRISLARAAYDRSAQLVVMDDPLSAVDPHVAEYIFTNCICGIMTGRTRILVTNSIKIASACDQIFVMQRYGDTAEVKDNNETTFKNCKIAASGTFEDLSSSNSNIQEMQSIIKSSLQNNDLNNNNNDENNDEALLNNNNLLLNGGKRKKKLAATSSSKLVEDEQRERGSVHKDIYKQYINAAGGMWLWGLIVFLAASILASDFWGSYWIYLWISDLERGENANHNNNYYVTIYALSVIASSIVIVCKSVLVMSAGLYASKRLHQNLIEGILSKQLSFFHKHPLGRLLNRFSKDLYEIDMNLPILFDHSLMSYAAVILVLVLVAVITTPLLVLLIPMIVIYVYLHRLYSNVSRSLQRAEAIYRSPLFNHVTETINGVSSIRVLGVVNSFKKEFETLLDCHQKAAFLTKATDLWLQIRLDLLAGLLILATCITLAIMHSNISVGIASLLMTQVLTLPHYLTWSVRQTSQIEAKMNSVERIFEYVNNHNEKEKQDGLIPNNKQWPIKGTIQFDNIRMRYRPDLPLVLKNLTLNIPAGKRVGLVGRTGSGKSSLLTCLFRIVNYKGQIRIDDIDIKSIPLEFLRQNIAIIPQNPILLPGTVKFNLDPLGKHSDEAMWNVLDMVNLKSKVLNLNQIIGEQDLCFSMGEQQLFCLCRALLRQPRILCLDEATASVDIVTDRHMQKTLNEAFPNTTILTIAHRLDTILDYDYIAVLNQGTLIEYDSPNKLLSNTNSLFYSMMESFKKQQQ